MRTADLETGATEPNLLTLELRMEFDVDGPAIHRPYNVSPGVLLKPATVEAHVRVHNGTPEVFRLVIKGSRAKKDGSHSLSEMQDTWYPTTIRMTQGGLPEYIMAVADEALRLTRDMIRHNPEVTV